MQYFRQALIAICICLYGLIVVALGIGGISVIADFSIGSRSPLPDGARSLSRLDLYESLPITVDLPTHSELPVTQGR